MKRIVLKPGEEERSLAGHLWVFSNEIARVEDAPEAGDIVGMVSSRGAFLGQGFYNPHSLISFRMLSRDDRPIDAAFWDEKLSRAGGLRSRAYPGARSFRAVFGESDGLPGLIVDKYEQYLAVQFLSAGLEKHQAAIVAALRRVFDPRGIIARNDSALRKLEGLEEAVKVISGAVPERVQIEENGIRYQADLRGGQKTGFFFDQRDNRRVFAQYCKGKRVLDAFCHTGGFGISAALAGATSVTWMDASRQALALAEENASLNGLSSMFAGICGDAMDYFADTPAGTGKFDIINIDPPALIKNKKHIPAGYRAYRSLNAHALMMLDTGGILAASSCSHHLAPEDFRRMLREAAGKARRQVRLLELRSQAGDHPVILSMPETEYLKFAMVEVI